MRDLRPWTAKAPEQADVSEWVGAMKELLADVRIGEQYVYFDGLIVPVNAASLRFEGWHSRHDLPFVPQVAAMQNRTVLQTLLRSRDYWERTALGPDPE